MVHERGIGGRWTAEVVVVENWREALRLCLAACGDDEVNAALLAILRPLPGETETSRPRAVMAAFCLADEPNVREEIAEGVLRTLAAAVRGNDDDVTRYSTLLAAVKDLNRSLWSQHLRDQLLLRWLADTPDSQDTWKDSWHLRHFVF